MIKQLKIAKEKYKNKPTVFTFCGYKTKVIGEITINYVYNTINCDTAVLYSKDKDEWAKIIE